MTVWNIIIILTVALAGNVLMAQEKVCSSLCTTVGMLESSPGESCDDIYQVNKMTRGTSGYYWINTTSGTHQVYCDMKLQCGGHKGGWTRVAKFDTSQGDPCPSGWNLITAPDSNAKNVCQSEDTSECHPTIFDTYNISFYKICGQVRGYQKGRTNAFSSSVKSIDDHYVDGVSITLGNPRKHVWTYAVGISDSRSSSPTPHFCPCAATKGTDPPSFVSNYYYCESNNVEGTNETKYYTTNPLWDGLDCSESVNCCAHPDMPWFSRYFTVAQETFIEARICLDEGFSNEIILVESMELYIQ